MHNKKRTKILQSAPRLCKNTSAVHEFLAYLLATFYISSNFLDFWRLLPFLGNWSSFQCIKQSYCHVFTYLMHAQCWSSLVCLWLVANVIQAGHRLLKRKIEKTDEGKVISTVIHARVTHSCCAAKCVKQKQSRELIFQVILIRL